MTWFKWGTSATTAAPNWWGPDRASSPAKPACRRPARSHKRPSWMFPGALTGKTTGEHAAAQAGMEFDQRWTAALVVWSLALAEDRSRPGARDRAPGSEPWRGITKAAASLSRARGAQFVPQGGNKALPVFLSKNRAAEALKNPTYAGRDPFINFLSYKPRCTIYYKYTSGKRC